MWADLLAEWAKGDDPRPPVFILVAKNKKIAKARYEWIGEDIRPPGIPALNIMEFPVLPRQHRGFCYCA